MKKYFTPRNNQPSDNEFSDRFKRRVNRAFREYDGFDNIPHPDVDNAFERFTTKLYLKLIKKSSKYANLLLYL